MPVAIAGLGPGLAATGTGERLLIPVESQVVLEAAKLAELFPAVWSLASEDVVIPLRLGVSMVRRRVLRALDGTDFHLGCFCNRLS